jgi:hypothetical protein
VIEKTFRPWHGRERIPNGYGIDDARSYFHEDELRAIADGVSTDALDRERTAFSRYVYDEHRRVARQPSPRSKAAPTVIFRHHYPGALYAPRTVAYSCSRYWFFAHALPRGEGRPHLRRDVAQRVFGLHDADMAKWCPELPWSLCEKSAELAATGKYPRAGIPAEMAELIGLDASMRWRREPSYYPPPQVRRLMDPIHESLGLSQFYYAAKYAGFLGFCWNAGYYADGELKVEKEIAEIVEDKADYRSRLLAIFD